MAFALGKRRSYPLSYERVVCLLRFIHDAVAHHLVEGN